MFLIFLFSIFSYCNENETQQTTYRTQLEEFPPERDGTLVKDFIYYLDQALEKAKEEYTCKTIIVQNITQAFRDVLNRSLFHDPLISSRGNFLTALDCLQNLAEIVQLNVLQSSQVIAEKLSETIKQFNLDHIVEIYDQILNDRISTQPIDQLMNESHAEFVKNKEKFLGFYHLFINTTKKSITDALIDADILEPRDNSTNNETEIENEDEITYSKTELIPHLLNAFVDLSKSASNFAVAATHSRLQTFQDIIGGDPFQKINIFAQQLINETNLMLYTFRKSNDNVYSNMTFSETFKLLKSELKTGVKKLVRDYKKSLRKIGTNTFHQIINNTIEEVVPVEVEVNSTDANSTNSTSTVAKKIIYQKKYNKEDVLNAINAVKKQASGFINETRQAWREGREDMEFLKQTVRERSKKMKEKAQEALKKEFEDE